MSKKVHRPRPTPVSVEVECSWVDYRSVLSPFVLGSLQTNRAGPRVPTHSSLPTSLRWQGCRFTSLPPYREVPCPKTMVFPFFTLTRPCLPYRYSPQGSSPGPVDRSHPGVGHSCLLSLLLSPSFISPLFPFPIPDLVDPIWRLDS